MKKTICGLAILSIVFFTPTYAFAQQQATYQVPDTYNFDYEVVQQVKDQKSSGNPKLLTYYYTQSGDYMGIRPNDDKTKLLVFTKDGVNVIIDDQKKTIIAMRLGNLIGDLGKAFAGQNKTNGAPGALKPDSSGKVQSMKTGNTKQICGYPAEEYRYTNNKGQTGSVWCAKVDFNASLFYMMGAMSGGRPGMSKYPQSDNYPAFNDPHLLLAESSSAEHPGEGIVTQSISKKTTAFVTKGYTINNMSNMGLKEMMEMKGKQN
jgi:hypothetical protein